VNAQGKISLAAFAYSAGATCAGEPVEAVVAGGLVDILHAGVVVATHAQRLRGDQADACADSHLRGGSSLRSGTILAAVNTIARVRSVGGQLVRPMKALAQSFAERAVERAVLTVDMNAVLDQIDINALLDRADADKLAARVDLDRLLARMDLDSLEAAQKVLARELRRRRRAQTAPRSNGANGSGSGRPLLWPRVTDYDSALLACSRSSP